AGVVNVSPTNRNIAIPAIEDQTCRPQIARSACDPGA
ncbi:unnamed protein product, partial [Allacma fusca]